MAGTTNKLTPLEFKPGIYKNITKNQASGLFVEGDKVRFSKGRVESIGGWVTWTKTNSIVGSSRAAIYWRALDQQVYGAVGTNKKLYIDFGDTYYDITPVELSASYTDKLTTSSGFPTVNVEISLHGRLVGDYLVFPSSVTIGGITLSGEYTVTSVVDTNNFVITHSANATSTVVNGGGTYTIQLLISNGLADSGNFATGWGIGDFGEETWGTARSVGAFSKARLWCLNNWGEDLIASYTPGGPMYYWDRSVGTGVRAQIISTAPNQNNFVRVSKRFRQVLTFGTKDLSGVFDPLLIRWSDIGDYSVWTPSLSNSARLFRLPEGNEIIGATETKGGDFLVWTDSSTYLMRPTDGDEVYLVEPLSDSIGMVAPNACIDVDGTVIWWSNSGLYKYDGSVRPLQTTVDNFIFARDGGGKLNTVQRQKVWVLHNQLYNEIYFFYPANNDTEISRYLVVNYEENTFYDGSMVRLCGFGVGLFDYPVMFDDTNVVYQHEVGYTANGAPLNSYIESGYYRVSEGDQIMFIDRMLLDGEIQGNLQVQLSALNFLKVETPRTKTYTYSPTLNPQLDVRARGRFISVKFTSNTFNGFMRLGSPYIGVQPDGKR